MKNKTLKADLDSLENLHQELQTLSKINSIILSERKEKALINNIKNNIKSEEFLSKHEFSVILLNRFANFSPEEKCNFLKLLFTITSEEKIRNSKKTIEIIKKMLFP